jgi:hypothetical protein
MYKIENLDRVLASFNRISESPLSFTEIEQGLDFQIALQELDAIVLKLAKDGYITPKEVISKSPINEYRYYLSFDGLMFLEQGGYVGELNYKLAKEKAISDQNQRMERNEELLVKWTKRLSYMTIVAALIIVAWEMYRTFCLHL